MRLISRVVWSLVGTLACLGATANADSGVLDIGVVFPRQNETYAPTDRFPIIFALQNAQLATHLKPVIWSNVFNSTVTTADGIASKTFDLEWANYTNYTTEPYLLYAFRDFRTEGPLQLRFYAGWRICNDSDEDVWINTNNTRGTSLFVDFDIREGGQTADLVAATAEEVECPAHVGFTINVTGETHDVDFNYKGNKDLTGTCAVVDSSSPTPDSNPCRVRIDEAAVESIEAEDLAWRCSHSMAIPVDGCPEEDNALQQLAVAGGATFAAVLAAMTFLLA